MRWYSNRISHRRFYLVTLRYCFVLLLIPPFYLILTCPVRFLCHAMWLADEIPLASDKSSDCFPLWLCQEVRFIVLRLSFFSDLRVFYYVTILLRITSLTIFSILYSKRHFLPIMQFRVVYLHDRVKKFSWLLCVQLDSYLSHSLINFSLLANNENSRGWSSRYSAHCMHQKNDHTAAFC